MKIRNVSLIAILAMSGLLALSAGLSAQSTNSTAPDRPRQGPGGGSVDARLARLTEQLGLTDEQKPKVKAVLEAQIKDMAGSRDLPPEERRAKGMAAREEMNKKMKEILTEEQFKKYEALPQGRGPGGPRPNAGGGENSAGGEKKPDAPKP